MLAPGQNVVLHTTRILTFKTTFGMTRDKQQNQAVPDKDCQRINGVNITQYGIATAQ